MSRKNELTEKQKRFVEEYLSCFNATQAAIEAGYAESYAGRQAYALLKNPLVQEYLKERQTDLAQRTNITQEKVINELAAVAFFDLTEAVKIVKKGRGYAVEFVPTDNLTDKQKKAISNIKRGKFGIEVKAHDKIHALRLLGEHLGLFEEKEDSSRLDKLDDILSRIEGNI